ncbi:hypothetical protein [Stakelama marina]|uniref:Uncharacterized protein n=1 Tax=Stakelama marina TaxID=2826939 RepID=A0A8T4IH93_9SPHN|nr:hypothetical protein [Stakelama marina]MBR0554003.1 hypothetical protein [Stakelama marina]
MKARRILQFAIGIVLLLAVAGFTYVRSMTPKLELGVGYAARVACGCRYIEGRPLNSCPTDFEPGMEPIRLKDDPATRTVTAYVPLIASRSATFDPVLGCQPQPFKGTPLKVHDAKP